MITLKNSLFLLMLTLYLYVVYTVYHYYTTGDGSISSIIKNEECNRIVFTNMSVMCITTLFYELLRGDTFSFVTVLFLITGVIGVILYDCTLYYTIHYTFCFMVFISILLFMFHHCYRVNHIILYLLLYLQEILGAVTLLETNIMNGEIILLVNFAVYYIYLHFI